jgi:TolA-binding protein
MDDQLPSEQQIDDYLLDRLSESEEQAFEVGMAAEPAWKEAVVARRLEREAMELLIAEDLRQQMKHWQAEEEASERTQTRILRIGGAITAIAASILILWLVLAPDDSRFGERSDSGAIAEQPTTPIQADSGSEPEVIPIPEPNLADNPKPDKVEPDKPESLPDAQMGYIALANKQYKPLAYDFSLRGTESTAALSPLDTALQAYDRGNFREAIRRFEAIGPESGEATYENAQKYLAHAYFRQGTYERAAALFQQQKEQVENFDPIRGRELEWSLTLSLLAAYPAHQQQVDSLLSRIQQPESRHNARRKEAAAEITAALQR